MKDWEVFEIHAIGKRVDSFLIQRNHRSNRWNILKLYGEGNICSLTSFASLIESKDYIQRIVVRPKFQITEFRKGAWRIQYESNQWKVYFGVDFMSKHGTYVKAKKHVERLINSRRFPV